MQKKKKTFFLEFFFQDAHNFNIFFKNYYLIWLKIHLKQTI
jgi:hypothetical protein